MNLSYRIPGQDIVNCNGSFRRLGSYEKMDGFVVSSADGLQRFVFDSNLTEAAPIPTLDVPFEISKMDYMESIDKLLLAMKHAGLVKVVVSRVASHSFPTESKHSLFIKLCQTYPNALVYQFEDEYLGSWIGASPEVLLRRIKNNYFTMSLAGTKSNLDTTKSWTQKEYQEQALVTDYLKHELSNIGVDSIESEGPYDHNAGPITHLRTDITFDYDEKKENEIIAQLHPTPAVCGLPKDMAIEAISLIERHQRELYSGFIGIFSQENTFCYVNLRCAKIINNRLYAFLGGGITVDSIPEDEWEETENKSKTLFDLIEID